MWNPSAAAQFFTFLLIFIIFYHFFIVFHHFHLQGGVEPLGCRSILHFFVNFHNFSSLFTIFYYFFITFSSLSFTGWCGTPRLLLNSSRSETIFFSLYANAIAEGGRNEINYFFTFFTSRAQIYACPPSLLLNWACAVCMFDTSSCANSLLYFLNCIHSITL